MVIKISVLSLLVFVLLKVLVQYSCMQNSFKAQKQRKDICCSVKEPSSCNCPFLLKYLSSLSISQMFTCWCRKDSLTPSSKNYTKLCSNIRLNFTHIRLNFVHEVILCTSVGRRYEKWSQCLCKNGSSQSMKPTFMVAQPWGFSKKGI